MNTIALFKQIAEVSSSNVIEFKDNLSLIDYIYKLTPKEKKPIIPDKREKDSLDKRTLGIWDVEKEIRDKLKENNDFFVIENNFRKYLGGIDIGLFKADFATARTGTLVLKSSSENLRILSMISEINVVLLKKESVVLDFEDCIKELNTYIQAGGFISFITGPSRTADIERVLTLGVHGPFEIHIALMD